MFENMTFSDVLQGVIVLVLAIPFAYLLLTGQPVPTELSGAMMWVIGYFFGKNQAEVVARIVAAAKK